MIQAPGFPQEYYPSQERLDRDKHSNLIVWIVSEEETKSFFFNLDDRNGIKNYLSKSTDEESRERNDNETSSLRDLGPML
jgi:hypothetical protein